MLLDILQVAKCSFKRESDLESERVGQGAKLQPLRLMHVVATQDEK